LLFPGFCLVGGGSGVSRSCGSQCQLDPFGQIYATKRGLEGVVLRQWASRQRQYKTKSNKSRCQTS
jgi:hypothetical protein